MEPISVATNERRPGEALVITSPAELVPGQSHPERSSTISPPLAGIVDQNFKSFCSINLPLASTLEEPGSIDQSITSSRVTTLEDPTISSPALSKHQDAALGDFSALPYELRILIWRNFVPQTPQRPTPQSPQDPSQNGDLGILRCSKRINAEISAELYPKREIIKIMITPKYSYQDWLIVSTLENGAEWHLRSFDDLVLRGFLHFPYNRIAGVIIDIDAPDPRDPGQLVCLAMKAQDIAKLVEEAAQRPKRLKILLRSTETTHWFHDKQPQKCIHITTNDHECCCRPDWRVVLFAFSRIRNIKYPMVKISNDMGARAQTRAARYQLRDSMKRTEVFGTVKELLWNDTTMRAVMTSHVTKLRVWMSQVLRVRGETAWKLFFDRRKVAHYLAEDPMCDVTLLVIQPSKI